MNEEIEISKITLKNERGKTMKKGKMLLLILMITIGIIMGKGTNSQAALQSNGGSPAGKGINEWITGIRQMQATGGTLGLTDSINGTNLTSGNKNLDIHMQKNTEYGAMVILSASSYGNPNSITDGQTTTGNETGVKIKINKEWVAAGTSNSKATSLANAAGRYKNQYTAPTYTEKVGDAIATIGGWHGSGTTTWISCYKNNANTINYGCLIRSYAGSVFSYYGYGYEYMSNTGDGPDYDTTRRNADYRKPWHSRAVVVVGSGI